MTNSLSYGDRWSHVRNGFFICYCDNSLLKKSVTKLLKINILLFYFFNNWKSYKTAAHACGIYPEPNPCPITRHDRLEAITMKTDRNTFSGPHLVTITPSEWTTLLRQAWRRRSVMVAYNPSRFVHMCRKRRDCHNLWVSHLGLWRDHKQSNKIKQTVEKGVKCHLRAHKELLQLYCKWDVEWRRTGCHKVAAAAAGGKTEGVRLSRQPQCRHAFLIVS